MLPLISSNNVNTRIPKLHTFFISNSFLQLKLSAAQLFHELGIKCCLGVA